MPQVYANLTACTYIRLRIEGRGGGFWDHIPRQTLAVHALLLMAGQAQEHGSMQAIMATLCLAASVALMQNRSNLAGLTK